MSADDSAAAAINEALAQNAQGPRGVTVGNSSVQQHSLVEQIAAANHAAAQAAAAQPGFGLRFTKLVPPGAG